MRSTDASQLEFDDARSAGAHSDRQPALDRERKSRGALVPGLALESSGYVGRVAALAVALGVGVAIASMQPVALADASEPGGSANSNSSSKTEDSPGQSPASANVSESLDSAGESLSAETSFGASSGAASDEPTDDGLEVDEADVDFADSDGDDQTDAIDHTSTSVSDDLDLGSEAADLASAVDALGTKRAAHRAEPSGTAAAASSSGAFRLFGNGTAENPNAGILFGSGFSWSASSCTGGTACHGGNAGMWGGNGGNGFNGGNGGSAGWSGNGGNGGAGVAGGNGGNGGRGGIIFGTGGNGGPGGAALVAGGAPGLGGAGGKGGIFGRSGQAGAKGGAFPGPSAPTEPPSQTVEAGVTFDFVYGTGSQHWSGAAREALQAAASSLASYLVVESPVKLTINVTGENAPLSSTLAWASSDLSASGAGFLGTVAQKKILTGVDPNGAAADGRVHFNFGPSWGLGDSVSSSRYDFQATAMHELMHALGFISFVDRSGSNTSRTWTTFDSFIVDGNGVDVIGSDLRWKSAYNPNLTGGNGGLYFGGPNAVAVYGGLVPLYTPSPWASGSSVSHLDDDTFRGANRQMMNAFVKRGPGIRTLSSIELAMLEDLGYTVISYQGTYGVLFLTIIFLRRRKVA